MEIALPNGRRLVVPTGVEPEGACADPVSGGRAMIAFPAGVKVWIAAWRD
ncbi:hypothetical protein [Roseovarius sp. M141]|nr:hypothetical protein [Roseovarius sp. M141]